MIDMTHYGPSSELLSAIKQFEGCRLTAYKPVKTEKYWTIGYGHYSKSIKQGQQITQQMADKLLIIDLTQYCSYVNRLNICKTQGQFDALVDFCFNLGCDSLGRSTLLRYIREGRPTQDIQAQILRWNRAGGKVLEGLTKRRQWEAERWSH